MNFAFFKQLLHSKNYSPADRYREIVNLPFTDKLQATNLGLGIVVLLLVNKQTNTLDRIALSDTELASGAVKMSAKPFNQIKIPLEHTENQLITAIKTRKPQRTSDWSTMFTPELTAQEARFNQAGAGIDCSFMYPLISTSSKEPVGAMIFSYFEPLSNITEKHLEFMNHYSEIVSVALEKNKD